MRLAALPPYKEEIEELSKYLRVQVEKMKINVELNVEGAIKEIENRKPDVSVIAIGGSPIIPKVPGIESNNVVQALDVLAGKAPVGKRVLIVGGGAIGCETADYLAGQGKHVTILEMLEELGSDLGKSIRDTLLQRLKRKGVKMNLNTKMAAIKRRGVLGMTGGHSMEFFEAETIVLALGVKPDSELFEEFKRKVESLYAIGDCRDSGRIAGAMRDAVNLGWEI